MPRLAGPAVRLALSLALSLAACALSAPAVADSAEDPSCPRLAPIPGRGVFRDVCTGRQIIVHGVNAVRKAAPWLPSAGAFQAQYSLGPEDAEILQSWGMNGVRLGVMWPGAMPQPGVIDAGYVQRAVELTGILSNRSIFTLLDAHQDLLSSKFCGEGAPDWAVEQISTGPDAFPAPISAPFKLNASGHPAKADCDRFPWADFQLTVASARAYQALYKDHNATAARFAQFWSAVVKAFRDAPHIIGAELLNEPFAGAVFDDPLLLLPGVADRENLQPFYSALGSAVVAADPRMPVFFESVTWDDFVPVGFNTTPTADPAKSGLSFHYYDLPNFNADLQVASRLDDARRLGVGAFLTEFNIGDGAMKPGSLNETLAVADAHTMSWLGWEYKPMVEITGWGWGPIFPNGTRNDAEVSLLARPYPQAVCGNVTSYAFDDATRVFTMAFAPAAGCDTEVYLNCQLHFPGCSPTVTVSTPDAVASRVEPAPAPVSTRATQFATLRLSLRPGATPPAETTVTMSP
ncbi:hypothetical protein FNF31_03900 [Cafeteria roenbergensis]|uniref:Glycoside hydrolase family 5 domain-containing protein n=1 Tax=Cafeteria roenbergensis TaxID=33653 RepID=A0A5A8D7C0_CAFRO|nr:hypothetical protein FNF31_03900 [Cafeteria roenbergensis]